MSVAVLQASTPSPCPSPSVSAPSSISSSPSSHHCPHSILRPCSSIVKPSKHAAGNMRPGWLASPPRELCCPRPAPIVLKESPQTFTAPAHALLADETLLPTPLSPTASLTSVTDSSPSLSQSYSETLSSTTSSSPSIRFGVLPERPPELRRSNSIALGVLSRKSMLHAQGNVSNNSNARRVVVMTDEEWEAYQRQFNKNQTQAVDLGAVMKSGARTFLTKLRRNSSTSASSSNGPLSPASSRASRDHSSPAPAASVASAVAVVPEVPEEDGEEDETPRTGRSPSPSPATQMPALAPIQNLTLPVFDNSLQLTDEDGKMELDLALTGSRPAIQRSVSDA